jgi:hypothetical protein
LANGIPRIYGNIQLKKISKDFIDNNQNPDPIVREDILKSSETYSSEPFASLCQVK